MFAPFPNGCVPLSGRAHGVRGPLDERGLVKHEIAFVDAAWPWNPLDHRRVRYWRVAGRATLFVLLACSGLQYYFLDVYLTIMTMPRVTVLAGLP